MIERMKKLTFLIAENKRDDFLFAIRHAGVIHIKKIKESEGASLPETEEELSAVEKVIDILSAYDKKGKGKTREWTEDELFAEAEKIIDVFNEKERLLQRIGDLQGDRLWFEKWGKIDPEELKTLREKGVNIRLYRLGKEDFKKLKGQDNLRVISKDKEFFYVMLLSYGTDDKLLFEEVGLPSRASSSIEKDLKELNLQKEQQEKILKESAKDIEPLKELKEKVAKRLEFLSVKFGMKEEKKFSYMQGFCPVRELDNVLSLAKSHGAGYMSEEPDNPDETPTLIRNPKWIDIVKPVFKFMNTVPGYEEFDISLVFLVFFSLFFAMLVGDAGYGMLFLIITFLVRRKARKAPYQPFFLMYLLSTATIIWGVITGTYFGAQQIAKLPFISDLVIGKINSFSDVNQNFMMFLCFLIGAVHLTIAHVTRFFRFMNSPKAIAEVGWIAIIWGMFYAAGTLVIARPFPGFALYLLAGGILLVLFFANFQKNFMKGIPKTLTELPLSVIAAFSDVVSYLRLFAVGYASVVVAESFNNMAVGGGIKSILGGLVAALILFFGHALNITLALMAVVVHGIRLNMLEFSSHMGMQWSGKEYKPFTE